MPTEYGTPKSRSEVDTSLHTTDPLEVVETFNELCFQYRLQEAFDRFISDDLIVHDPEIKGGGRDGLYERMCEFGLDKPPATPSDMACIVDKQFAHGPLVTVMHHVFLNAQDPGTLFMDLIHVEDGKIVEFWTTHLAVPETSANPHTIW